MTRWNVPGARQSGSFGAARASGFFSSKRRWGHYSKIVLLSVLYSGMPCDVNYWLSFAVSPVLDGFISTPISVSSTVSAVEEMGYR